MKSFLNYGSCLLIGWWMAMSILTSCVNQIAEEVEVGTVPINFSVQVQKAGTKVTGTAFDSGDEAGLFAMLSSVDITGQRYIDNLRLVCDGTDALIPEREVFYPEGESSLDMFSYYPYQSSGVETDKSQMVVSVKADQSSGNNFSLSDFLVAEAPQVKSSPDPVELTFQHKFCKIELMLVPSEDEDIDDLLEADPRIIASGFYTTATYDFLTGTFGQLSDPADIIPYGEWKKEDGCLTGKEFIVVPQGQPDGSQLFTMEWNGKVYVCPMPDVDMQSDVVCEISINAFQSTSHTLSGAVSSIKEWGTVEKGEGDTQVALSSVKTAALSFKPSKVYRVYLNSTAVAEVCKEYLLSEEYGLDTQALVAYPVDNEQADLTKGIVLQLLNTGQPLHGGNIRWDEGGNTFGYTPGTKEPVTEFYIDSSGNICLEKPKNVADINISCYTLRDIRGGELQTYPIVKVGSQYWLGEDLRARQYTWAEKVLEQVSQLGEPGYLISRGCYFYTGEALLAGEIAPYGWRIPTRQDWDQLMDYVGQDMSRLKGGTWKGFDASDTVYPATDETGLAILSNGLYIFNAEGKTTHYNWQTTAAYWVGENTPCTLTDESIMLMGNSNEVSVGGNHPKGEECYAGLSIRCIKE